MGSSSSRHQQRPQPPPEGAYTPFAAQQQGSPPPAHHYQQQQQVMPYTHGQFYGGYAPPQQIVPPPAYWGPQFAQLPTAGSAFGQSAARRHVPAAEYTQTATIKNLVNLKKASLRLEPLPGRPHDFGLRFSFDAAAPCRVTTFLLATEDPREGCRIVSAVQSAPPRTPAYYEKGLDQKFPPPGDAAADEAHVVSSLHAPMGHMVLASGDSYPLIIRLETLGEDGRKEGRTLQELAVGGPLPQWAQAQTTYAKLKQDDDGEWQVVLMKQKIWVKGVSYELQEIYGMESAKSGKQGGAGGGGCYDELAGGECVVCMSAERDTTVLPCRHMCLCRECALALKTRTNKCPICRNEIDSLLHIKIARKGSASSSTAAAAASERQHSGPPPAPA